MYHNQLHASSTVLAIREDQWKYKDRQKEKHQIHQHEASSFISNSSLHSVLYTWLRQQVHSAQAKESRESILPPTLEKQMNDGFLDYV